MKYPYEAVGIITSVVILVTILVVGMVMTNPCDFDFIVCKGSGAGGSGGSHTGELPKAEAWKPEPQSIWDDYYKDIMDMQLDCKKASKNLQEFYDCVNNP